MAAFLLQNFFTLFVVVNAVESALTNVASSQPDAKHGLFGEEITTPEQVANVGEVMPPRPSSPAGEDQTRGGGRG